MDSPVMDQSELAGIAPMALLGCRDALCAEQRVRFPRRGPF